VVAFLKSRRPTADGNGAPRSVCENPTKAAPGPHLQSQKCNHQGPTGLTTLSKGHFPQGLRAHSTGLITGAWETKKA